MFDFDNINEMDPKKGCLLIAEPLLLDPFFKRTVVFVCEHNEQGTMGFILNKYLDVDFNSLRDDLPTFDGAVAVGGPVQGDNLFYLHTLGDRVEGSVEVAPGIYMGGSYEDIQNLILGGVATSENVRFFIGYSGWGSDQLQEEMGVNSWIVADHTMVDIMNTDDEKLWENTLKKMGKKYEILTHFPEDPSMN